MADEVKYWTEERRKDAIAGMREVCDFLEANPEFTMPNGFDALHIQNFEKLNSAEEARNWFLHQAQILGEATPGNDDSQFYLIRNFKGVRVILFTGLRSLCTERIVQSIQQVSIETNQTVLECIPEAIALGFSNPLTPDWMQPKNTGANLPQTNPEIR